MLETIKTYLQENEDALINVVEELNSWNGYAQDEQHYEMYMLDEFYHDTEPTELLYRAFYGYDADNTYTDDRGDKHYAEFNPNREYFYYNGYGNLVNTDYKDYSYLLDDYLINALIENYENLYIDDEELKGLIETEIKKEEE